MASATVSCPYCNATQPRPRTPPTNGRLLCPRCGEMFPYRPAAADEVAAEPSSSVPEHIPHEPDVPVPQRWSNRAIATTVLAVMGTMAVIGLFFALQTASIRREHDLGIRKPEVLSVPFFIKVASNLWVLGLILLLFSVWHERMQARGDTTFIPRGRFRWLTGFAIVLIAACLAVNLFSGPLKKRVTQLPGEAETPVARAKAPARLEALAYLPGDVNLVAAANIAGALDSPTGKEYLDRLQIGRLDLGPEQVQKWTGLQRDQIDHVVLGLKIDDLIVPRLTLVVRTRQPYDAAAVLAALKAVPAPESGKKDRYRFPLGRSLQPALWLPAEGNTLVVALTPKDLDAVPRQPVAGVDHLPPALRDLLQERMRQPTPLWLAAHSDRWDQSVLPLTLPPADKDVLTQLRTFGVWLLFDQDITLNATADCKTAAAATQLKAYLERWAKPPLKDVKVVQQETWISAQVHGTVEDVHRALAGGQ